MAVIRNFDLHEHRQRFAMLKAPEAQAEAKLVVFIFNFFDELRRGGGERTRMSLAPGPLLGPYHPGVTEESN